MVYNTGNPLGSKDPRDVYDNATNLDNYSVGSEPWYPNRFGVLKLSIEGQQQAFQAAQEGRDAEFQVALQATGFVEIGNYGAGLTITGRNQVFLRSGLWYSANSTLALPYTLTGNWAVESVNFVQRSDALLRSELSASSGATLVGDGAGTVSTSLRALEGRATALETSVYTNLTDTSVSRTLALSDNYKLLRLTAAAAKSLIVPAQSDTVWPAESELKLFNDSTTTLTLSASLGVTLKLAYGGALVIPPGGFAWLKRLSADSWLLVSRASTVVSRTFSELEAWGDSITQGTGASSPQYSYVSVETESIRTPIANRGVGAACTWDLATPIYTRAVAVNEASQLMVGTNDSYRYAAAAGNLDTFKRSHAALLVWMAIPNVGKTLASSTAITYVGSWTTGSAYGATWQRRTEINGGTATFTFSGSTLYICATRYPGLTSGANVTVDGVLAGTISSTGYTSATTNGATYGPALYRFTGFSSGTHTVVLTTTGTNSSNAFLLEWFATPAAFNRSVNLLSIIKQLGGATDATIAAYNAAILDNVNTFKADGAKIALGDVTPIFNTATDLTGDGIHPNDLGMSKIAQVASASFAVMAAA